MAKPLRVPISTARTKLFQLTELVSQSGGDTSVVLEQRSGGEPVALVREAHLVYLEDRVAQIDRTEAAGFALAGSLESAVDDETLERVLREIRRQWGASSPPTGGPRTASRRPRR